ncbi:MAG: hypothetical protein ACK47B_00515 [Armatimonadota bacterium]
MIRPGFNDQRLIKLIQGSVEECRLDLAGRVVLTEAATGAYVVTPIIAALAGAERVLAFTRASRYGSLEEVTEVTTRLARAAGVESRLELVTCKLQGAAVADVVTNSGHLRPIDAEMIQRLQPHAVIPLMYEAWELRQKDLDLNACKRHGIAVAGTNERHPAIDVFSYLGCMALKALFDAGISVYSSRILLICDNPFSPYIERALRAAGAELLTVTSPMQLELPEKLDAVLVAVNPSANPVLGEEFARALSRRAPGAVVVQFWGDLERSHFCAHHLALWPEMPPAPGHMAVIPSDLGPEPVVRLQTGGLKVAEVLLRAAADRTPQDLEFIDAIC